MDKNSIKKRLIYLIISEAKSVGVNVDGDMFFALAFRSEEELTKIARGIGVSLKCKKT